MNESSNTSVSKKLSCRELWKFLGFEFQQKKKRRSDHDDYDDDYEEEEQSIAVWLLDISSVARGILLPPCDCSYRASSSV